MDNLFTNHAVIWFLIGLVLLLAELALPGLIIFFFGIGALVVALCCLVFDISLNTQLFLFLIASLTSLGFLRKIIRKRYTHFQDGKSGDIDEDYVGKIVIALQDFDNGQGKVSFKGTTWDASSKHPVSKGQTLIITGFESIQLFVEPVHHHTNS